MAKVCAFLSIQPYQKVGTNLCDAQKGEKGRILSCIGILNPQDCLNHQLNALRLLIAK